MIKKIGLYILVFLCPMALMAAPEGQPVEIPVPESSKQVAIAPTPNSQPSLESIDAENLKRAQAANVKLVGFQEWKKNQVFDARKNLDEFKSPQLSKMAEASASQASVETSEESEEELPGAEDLEVKDVANLNEKAEKLRQLEFNLEIAQGLTIHDYFALYLKNKSKEEMALAIAKLSSEELSELLIAYRKSLYGIPATKTTQETALQ